MVQRFICAGLIVASAAGYCSGSTPDNYRQYLNDSLPQRWSYPADTGAGVPAESEDWWGTFNEPRSRLPRINGDKQQLQPFDGITPFPNRA